MKLIVIAILILTLTCTVRASEQKRPATEYLKEARVAMFMANEVTKYCKELVLDEANFRAWYARLEGRLAEDGITDINAQVQSTSTSELLTALQKVMEENGGPFLFRAEKYCAYGRKEIANRTAIGGMLKEKDAG